jgi:hypothetical protein
MVAVPVSLLFATEAADSRADWAETVLLSAIEPSSSQNRKALGRVVEARAGGGAFEGNALENLIIRSGGVHAELIHLAKRACLRAIVANRQEVIAADAEGAIADRRNELAFGMTQMELSYLQVVRATGAFVPDKQAPALLERNLILYYRTLEHSRFAVHPVVEPLLDLGNISALTNR